MPPGYDSSRLKRIAIIGCGGAGKSTLSRELGKSLDLPVVHLDRVFWKPGWERISREAFIAEQLEIMAQPRWILDGNYGSTMDLRLQAADTIVFLDLPTHVCLWGAVKRYLQYRQGSIS